MARSREEGELVNGMRGRKKQRGEVRKHRVVEVGLNKRLQLIFQFLGEHDLL